MTMPQKAWLLQKNRRRRGTAVPPEPPEPPGPPPGIILKDAAGFVFKDAAGLILTVKG